MVISKDGFPPSLTPGRGEEENICSMRCVTMKPPTMLIVARRIAAVPTITIGDESGPLICSMPPSTMMPLMALVTLISGVCRAGVTLHTT